MEKRLVLAIALSVGILFAWSALAPKPQPIGNKAVSAITPPPSTAGPKEVNLPPALTPEPARDSLRKFDQDKYEVLFSEAEAAVKDVVFKDYQNHVFNLKKGFLLLTPDAGFRKEGTWAEEAKFIYQDDNQRIIKRFYFHNSSYAIDLEIETQNISGAPAKISLPLVLGVLDFSGDPEKARLQDIAVAREDKVLRPNPRKEALFSGVKFLGLRERYFCAIIEPASSGCSAFLKKITPQQFLLGITPQEVLLAPGEKNKQLFRIYLGPQNLQYISSIKPEWKAVMHYGTFDFIAQLLLQLLDILYKLVHNWGVTIIILSILIYILFYPLSLKQMRSMKQMQALQPRIEELKKKYKDEPQRLNKEIMELYREEKVNPFGGCIPVLLQIPIFFALYQVLIRSASLKGARFLWIKDLASPDRLFILPVSIPILGNEINLLPILMTIGMFAQQKFSMANATGASAEQQKLMLILFPLMFGFIFYHMPSGLVLYWFVNSALMLFYQFRTSRQK